MFTSACNSAVQMRNSGWGRSGSSTPIRSVSIIARPARSRISRPFSGWLSRNRREGTLGRLGHRKRHDPDHAAIETANDIQQLTDSILEKHGELPQRGIVTPALGLKVRAGAFAYTHENPGSEVSSLVWRPKHGLEGSRRRLPAANVRQQASWRQQSAITQQQPVRRTFVCRNAQQIVRPLPASWSHGRVSI